MATSAATAALLVGLALVPGTANAGPTLLAYPGSTGPIVVDSAGTGYMAWTSSQHGYPLYECKIPKGGACTNPSVLPLPKGANWEDYRVTQPFPVVGGKTGVISVVAPSYDFSDVVVWTSVDGGTHFGEPQVISNAHYDGTATWDILRSPDADPPYYPDEFVIASSNPGLFYTFTGTGSIGALHPPAGFQQNLGNTPGGVTQATVGYGRSAHPGLSQETQTVEAFSTNAANPELAYFWSPLPGVSGEPGALEHGPFKLATGANPRLASGPQGLYLLSEDYVASPNDATKPLHLDVRRWDPTTEKFGAPALVAKVPNDIDGTDEGGITEDATTGKLYVAWPMAAADGKFAMDLWSRAPGKPFSAPSVVASLSAGGYSGPARLAVTAGHGFLTWVDDAGLELVDLPSS